MKIELAVPYWIQERLNDYEFDFTVPDSRMEFVISLAKENVSRGTGGPFAAAIFDMSTWMPVSGGTNLVTTQKCSVYHAEIVAIMAAQKRLGCFELGSAGSGRYELVTSTEPCAMCLGAVPWSGVVSLVCGARDSDAREIGFDEGPKLETWVEALEERGISVLRDVAREKAVAVLKAYASSGGIIYNGRQGK